MHDEMLMTKADRLFGRREVDAMCAECHDKPHEDKPQELKAFLEKWRGRDRPNGRVVTDDVDLHRLPRDPRPGQESRRRADHGGPIGFRPSTAATWPAGRRPPAMPGRSTAAGSSPLRAPGAAADLWSDAPYGDFRLSVTFRWQGPVQAGIWLRGQPSTPGPRVEIFASRQTPAAAGSVHVPGKGLALVNLRDDLLDDEAWNTITAEARGPRVAVSVNGEEIGAVAIAGPAQGRIGLHVEGTAGGAGRAS